MVSALAVEHQRAQAGLVRIMLADFDTAWAELDAELLAVTLPRWNRAVTEVVRRYGSAGAALAADYYYAERAAAGMDGAALLVPVAPPADPEQIQTALAWATKPLWNDDPDMAAARTQAEGAAAKLTVDPGRATVLDAVAADDQARGWARLARASACSFCAMLATRHGAYRREETAEFRAHDHCHCVPVPVFDAYEPPQHVDAWDRLWTETTAGESGAAARRAFRRALENR